MFLFPLLPCFKSLQYTASWDIPEHTLPWCRLTFAETAAIKIAKILLRCQVLYVQYHNKRIQEVQMAPFVACLTPHHANTTEDCWPCIFQWLSTTGKEDHAGQSSLVWMFRSWYFCKSYLSGSTDVGPKPALATFLCAVHPGHKEHVSRRDWTPQPPYTLSYQYTIAKAIHIATHKLEVVDVWIDDLAELIGVTAVTRSVAQCDRVTRRHPAHDAFVCCTLDRVAAAVKFAARSLALNLQCSRQLLMSTSYCLTVLEYLSISMAHCSCGAST